MPGRMAYTINGPPFEGSPQNVPQRSPSIRRDPKAGSINLRAMYHDEAHNENEKELSSISGLPIVESTLKLPPTPPRAGNENNISVTDESLSDIPQFRSTLVTPTNPHSPPTPDDTPPRERNLVLRQRFLGTQPSFASTKAESFRTAREDIFSDDDSEWPQIADRATFRRHENLAIRSLTHTPVTDHEISSNSKRDTPSNAIIVTNGSVGAPREMKEEASTLHGQDENIADIDEARESDLGHDNTARDVITGEDNTTFIPHDAATSDAHHNRIPTSQDRSQDQQSNAFGILDNVRRGPSLRERLAESQQHSASTSTEKFASIIGWNNSVAGEVLPDNHRHSGISTTSTIEAFVFQPSTLPRKRTTLRHVSKNESLRSFSSPLPVSKRDSLNSNSDSPHRLVHKKARLSNQNRWSFGSEVSRSYSLPSSAALPKTEIIRVAVIPERNSSLRSSRSNSRRASISTTSGQSQPRRLGENPPSSWQHKRTISEVSERGRAVTAGLTVPPRKSSLSAPTSQSTSRAASVTSESIRVRRQEAETDLRKTLDRMESERLVVTLSDLRQEIAETEFNNKSKGNLAKPTGQPRNSSTSANNAQLQKPSEKYLQTPQRERWSAEEAINGVVPGSVEWAAMRPTSFGETPFSQPSFQSASPEINEARAVNFFPHNNHSLQLIEPNQTVESRAVREVRRQQMSEAQSPLRNPRRPPEPPQFRLFPPPHNGKMTQHNDIKQIEKPIRSAGSAGKLENRRNSASLLRSLSRNLSLKNARNRKADQNLDGSLHPFWRPRAFWDDQENDQTQTEESTHGDPGIINNSLGFSQDRSIINGPFSLVRRISERRRQTRMLAKQSSHSSLTRLRASRRLYKVPALGLPLRFFTFHDIQDRLLYARQRKENEKREKRREAIRQSIGANVVSKGDSRFPLSDTNLVKTMR